MKRRTSFGFAIFKADFTAFETVDECALYDWALPQIDRLRIDFYHSREPTENFPLWLRAQFLARKVAA